MLYEGLTTTLNIVFYNYIINYFNFQAYTSKIFARMFQIQLRYFQYILSLAIFVGILISSTPLISSCFVGLTLIWLTEMLSGQFDINSDKYYVVLILLLLSFSSVTFKNIFSSIEPHETFIIFLVVLMIYFIFQSDVNIFKIGNSIFITVITFLVNGYIVDSLFQENIFYISYIFLLLLFLKTLATYFNVQFGNFQFFFNFFLIFIVFNGVSTFYDYKTVNIIIGGTSIALFTTFITHVFTKLRFEYEITSKLSNQIYVFDYMFAFVLSLYFVDALNVLNGLF